MNIHEYQAKEILRRYGIPVPPGDVATSADQAERIARALSTTHIAVKAQIHAGGRGKAGGIKLVHSPLEARHAAQELIGKVLVTPQTGPRGRRVSKLLITAAQTPQRELYLAIVIDPRLGRPVILACAEGGVDIEALAAQTPEKILRLVIDPAFGLHPYQARNVAVALRLSGPHLPTATSLLLALYRMFIETDASLIEINPLIINQDGQLMALDAKMCFDDRALGRHPDIAALRDPEEEDPREREAARFGLRYRALDGTIGCIVNGIGLAMATADLIRHYGGRAANLVDVEDAATAQQIDAAFQLQWNEPQVRGILINIFGGSVPCDQIATALVQRVRSEHANRPVVARLEGTNAEPARRILQRSDGQILTADSLADAARTIVRATS